MLNRSQQVCLLNIARNTIEAYLHRKEILKWKVSDPELISCQGVFVSLHKGHQLRGCIGYIQPIEPLYEAVIKMAIAASTQDWRFPPTTIQELKDITVEITVLSELIPIQNISQIEIGTHGVQLTIGSHSAVFLPQVAKEQGWNMEELLQHLCRKAGLSDDDWKMPNASLFIFSGQVFSEGDVAAQ
ncbi:MAG: AmmeMemoRadiSam system protein A [bacterium]